MPEPVRLVEQSSDDRSYEFTCFAVVCLLGRVHELLYLLAARLPVCPMGLHLAVRGPFLLWRRLMALGRKRTRKSGYCSIFQA
jgi:hypothetical protein